MPSMRYISRSPSAGGVGKQQGGLRRSTTRQGGEQFCIHVVLCSSRRLLVLSSSHGFFGSFAKLFHLFSLSFRFRSGSLGL